MHDEAGPLASHDKLMVIRHLLGLCLYSILVVLVGNGLLVLAQVREALFAFDNINKASDAWHFFPLVISYLHWATSTWIAARLMLGRSFVHDPLGFDKPATGASLKRYANAWALGIPRVLGMIAITPLAIAMFTISWVYGLALSLVALGFCGMIVFRRRFRWLRSDVNGSDRKGNYRFFKHLPKKARRFVGFLFAVPVSALLAVWYSPIEVSRAIGTPALILLALSGIALVGSFALSYWPNTMGRSSFNWVPLVLFVATSTLVDNHPVAPPAAGNAEKWRQSRPSLTDHFKKWMEKYPGTNDPVYFVAVAGGASRSAYFSGMALAQLHDQARKNRLRFSENIFLISSVSGGSLGAAAFVAALSTSQSAEITDGLELMLQQDYLAPVVGMMLFPDLLQRFIPLELPRADRSLALEEAWVSGWKQAFPPAPGKPNLWEQNLTWLSANSVTERLPSLILNTVRVEDGQRVFQSNLKFEPPEAVDLLHERFDTESLTLARAVHNSARFPYISPVGQVRMAPGDNNPGKDVVWGHLGDGGYHESTGTASALDALSHLIEKRQIRSVDGRLMACSNATDPDTACKNPVVLIVLDGTPTPWGPRWQRDHFGAPYKRDLGRLEPSWPLGEVTAPGSGLQSAWKSNSVRAERRYSDIAGASNSVGYIELRFPQLPISRQPSMNWYLDYDSRKALKTATANPCSKVSVRNALGNQSQPSAEQGFANVSEGLLRHNLQRLCGLIDGTMKAPTP